MSSAKSPVERSNDAVRWAGVDEAATLHRFRRRTWQWALASLFFTLGLVSAIGFLVRPSYVAIVPGSARAISPLMSIDGAEVYPSEGDLLYTTIRLRQDMDLWSYLWVKSRGDAQLIDRDEYFGPVTPEESQEMNLARMTSAKDTAIAVALSALGYDTIEDAGVIVARIIDGSPADGVLHLGDVLIALDGETVTSDVQLIEALTAYGPGDVAVFTIIRAADGTQAEIEIELADNPDRPGVGFIGIGPATVADIVEPPFDVDIDSGAVGGPSAGLAFTLAILDDLTPGELTGGNRVAVTGTIGIDGRVGPIGGIRQKAVAVRKSGAVMFIVPAAQPQADLDAVADTLGDEVTLVPVEDLDGALDALRSIGGNVDVVEAFVLEGP